jgi:predicted Zn-dependent protease
VYLVAGVAPASQFNRADDSFQRSILSFRTLSRSEAERIQPNRVDFYVARQGDTWDSIARGPGNGTVRPATLAIMNGRDAATQPKAGERLRIVVGGN